MKASELRIGNYVYERRCDGSLHVGQITFIQSHEGSDKIKCGGWLADSPIPLTEEWLLKFGFEIGYNKTKMLDVYCKDFGFLIERSNGGNFYYKKVYVQHVHQLQNLYFALTGEELTLNDKI